MICFRSQRFLLLAALTLILAVLTAPDAGGQAPKPAAPATQPELARQRELERDAAVNLSLAKKSIQEDAFYNAKVALNVWRLSALDAVELMNVGVQGQAGRDVEEAERWARTVFAKEIAEMIRSSSAGDSSGTRAMPERTDSPDCCPPVSAPSRGLWTTKVTRAAVCTRAAPRYRPIRYWPRERGTASRGMIVLDSRSLGNRFAARPMASRRDPISMPKRPMSTMKRPSPVTSNDGMDPIPARAISVTSPMPQTVLLLKRLWRVMRA